MALGNRFVINACLISNKPGITFWLSVLKTPVGVQQWKKYTDLIFTGEVIIYSHSCDGKSGEVL